MTAAEVQALVGVEDYATLARGHAKNGRGIVHVWFEKGRMVYRRENRTQEKDEERASEEFDPMFLHEVGTWHFVNEKLRLLVHTFGGPVVG
jgi:hypothetical protein